MCDYSLHNVASRPAKVGDKLVTTQFFKIEVLSNQPGALRPDNNIREMKDFLDRLAAPSNLMAHLQSQARVQIDRLIANRS